MEWDERINICLSFGQLRIQVGKLGRDCVVLVWGGEKPHIGCTVLAVPRESLKQDGTVSVTSSVINVTGHKDEEICRYVAEKICCAKGTVTVCSGGFHMDGMTREQIEELVTAVRQNMDEYCRRPES